MIIVLNMREKPQLSFLKQLLENTCKWPYNTHNKLVNQPR